MTNIGGIVTKLLHEPETGIEPRGSCDVADIQHGFDALDHWRHANILTAIEPPTNNAGPL
jgi:hypothetical protein